MAGIMKLSFNMWKVPVLCILGREAAAGRERLTMKKLIKENKHLEMDLRGLKTQCRAITMNQIRTTP
jgi:hypothetical protein